MRNEDYDRELLAGITLICTALAVVVGLFDTTTPTNAGVASQTTARVEQLTPVRVVGTPFVPNTDPSVRLARD